VKSVVGIFRDRESARRAAAALRDMGMGPAHVNLLMPGDAGDPAAAGEVETSDMEQPGVGRAIGGVVGGAVGATAGMGLGTAAAMLLVPGVGPVAAIGLAAAALLGAGGAIGGAAAAGALEDHTAHGLPKDELYLYEEALRNDQSVVFALADDDAKAAEVRATLEANGAESVDAARDEWWVGIRDNEAQEYEGGPTAFAADEPLFRRGFEAALHPDRRGRSFDETRANLAECFGPDCDRAPFRRGYDRGGAHSQGLAQSFSEADTGEIAQRR
jgi:hypothetical protein